MECYFNPQGIEVLTDIFFDNITLEGAITLFVHAGVYVDERDGDSPLRSKRPFIKSILTSVNMDDLMDALLIEDHNKYISISTLNLSKDSFIETMNEFCDGCLDKYKNIKI